MWNGNQAGLTGFRSITGVTFPLLLRASGAADFGISSRGSIDAMMVVDQSGTIRRISGSGRFDISDTAELIRELLVPPAPIIGASVETLDFGPELEVGDSRTLSFQISNTGAVSLNVTAIQSDRPEIAVSATELTLAPGESQTVDVTLTAVRSGALSGTLDLLSNDPDRATLQLSIGPVTVRDLPPAIALAADRLDLGQIETNRTAQRTLTLRNEGRGPLQVTDVRSDLPSVSVSAKTFDLPPGESYTLTLTLSPGVEGPFSGTLEIVSNDPDRGAVALPLSFSAVVIPPDPRADFYGNGGVDFSDFLAFVGAFNTTDSTFDLDSSGRVDFSDFLTFAGSFGKSVN